ncbi:hypothetical protein GCM10027082_45350 [Comamonas humi]
MREHGVSLVELMVGIAIGLLVVAVAGGALMASRSVSGTVSDASQLQQDAAYAFRVIGQQLRQAGSLYLNPSAQGTDPLLNGGKSIDVAEPVAFEVSVQAKAGSGKPFNPKTHTISGSDDSLTLGYRRYKEPVFTADAPQSQARNCLGGPGTANTDLRVESIFRFNGTSLSCGGNDTANRLQPIIQNVANFRVRYLRQTAPHSSPQLQYVDAASIGSNWTQVFGIEVCLELYGNEPIDMPRGSTYTNCDGTAVDLAALTAPRTRRMHLVFRNVYQLRSQGLIG